MDFSPINIDKKVKIYNFLKLFNYWRNNYLIFLLRNISHDFGRFWERTFVFFCHQILENKTDNRHSTELKLHISYV